MYRNLIAILVLPLAGLVLLVGIIETAVAAEPPAAPTTSSVQPTPTAPPPAASEASPYLRSGFSLAPLAPAACCAGAGGPYEPAAPALADPDPNRWEILIDRRIEQRLRLPTHPPLNTFALRF